jgi:hypothetical protein
MVTNLQPLSYAKFLVEQNENMGERKGTTDEADQALLDFKAFRRRKPNAKAAKNTAAPVSPSSTKPS